MTPPERERRDDEGPSPRAMVLAAIVVIVLAIGGVIVAKGLVEMSKLQDCAMTGRSDC